MQESKIKKCNKKLFDSIIVKQYIRKDLNLKCRCKIEKYKNKMNYVLISGIKEHDIENIKKYLNDTFNLKFIVLNFDTK